MAKRKKTYDGWHFLPADCRLGYGDGRRVRKGVTYRVDGDPVKCKHGLHACRKLLDCLKYANGMMVAKVRLSGKLVIDGDKAVATERTELTRRVDASRVLHEFACWCAERALRRERKAGRESDKRCWEVIETKRRWLRGKATDRELTATKDAVWAAAWAAAEDAAGDAVYAAAWDAAGDAVWAAAWAATGAAVWAAVWAAAWAATGAATGAAEKRAQSRKLTTMLNDLLRRAGE